jgi:hypothetical protein
MRRWRRTLHTLDPVLPHEELLKRGTHLRRFRAGDAGRCIAQLTLSPPDPAPADPESGAGAAHGLPPGVLLSQAAMVRRQHGGGGACCGRSTRLNFVW